MRIIPKWLFQVIGLGSLLWIAIQAVSWIVNEDGFYRLIAGRISFLEDSLEKTSLAILVLFFASFIPWLIAILILREFTADVKTMKDEIAYLKGQSQPELFETPSQRGRFTGVVAIGMGVLLGGIDLLIWNTMHDGFVALWLAAPVSFILGVYALITGNFPRR
jgi:hypothetical protein